MVRFEGGPPARDGGRNPRWDEAGPGGKGGKSQGGKGSRGKGGSPSASGNGRYEHGQGCGGSGHCPTDGARRGSSHGGGSPGPEGSRPPGRIHADLNPGGAASTASGHAPDGAPGEPGYGDAPGESGPRLQVIMNAIGIQPTCILCQGRLEQQGCSFRYSSGNQGSWLITSAGLNVRLGRDSLGMPHLHGIITGPGVFVA